MLVAAVVAAALVVLGVGAGPASARAERGGDAVVADPGDPQQPLTAGGSAAVFTLALPEDASCPGDSANDDYRIQSFLVPVTDDPAELRYDLMGPVGDGRWALYGVDTTPFVHALTEMSEGPGHPGRIGGIPPLSFAVFPPGTIQPGEYRMGIACTLSRETMRYWDVTVRLLDAPSDEPGKLRWEVIDPPAVPGRGWGRLAWIVAGVAGVGAAALLVPWPAVFSRSSSRSDKEQPRDLSQNDPS
jgi:hypothetical protein